MNSTSNGTTWDVTKEGSPTYANYPEVSQDETLENPSPTFNEPDTSPDTSYGHATLGVVYPTIWVDAKGMGDICGNCQELLTRPGEDPEEGVITEIRSRAYDNRVTKVCPSCGAGNNGALLPAKRAPGFASLGPASAYAKNPARYPRPYTQTRPGRHRSGAFIVLFTLNAIIGFGVGITFLILGAPWHLTLLFLAWGVGSVAFLIWGDSTRFDEVPWWYWWL